MEWFESRSHPRPILTHYPNPPNTCPHTPTNQPTPNPKQVRWVSWPGAAVDLGSQEAVRRRLDTEYSCTPVFLSPEIADAYYHKVIWGFGLCV